MLNKADNKSFSDLFSVCLKMIDHLNLKLLKFYRHTASFKIRTSKVQDFGNFKLSPMNHVYTILFQTNLLASGGAESEIFIWDLNNHEKPMTPGAKSQVG